MTRPRWISPVEDLSVEPRRRFVIVHNPRAGLNGGNLTRKVAGELHNRGADVNILELPHGEISSEISRAIDRADAVISSGGDGTLRALAVAMTGRDPTLGLIPSGTANVMAAEIGMPHSSAAIARVLMEDPVVRVAGGRANGVPFFLMCGAGFDGEVISKLRPILKGRLGRLAYTLPIISALNQKAELVEVEVDGRRRVASWIVVANVRSYAGRYVIAPKASLLNPGFFAVLSKATTRAERCRELAALALGRIENEPHVEHHACSHLRIAAHLAVEIDGDFLTRGPLEVSADGLAMNLIMPRAFAH